MDGRPFSQANACSRVVNTIILTSFTLDRV
jgi:hypothetical protein